MTVYLWAGIVAGSALLVLVVLLAVMAVRLRALARAAAAARGALDAGMVGIRPARTPTRAVERG